MKTNDATLTEQSLIGTILRGLKFLAQSDDRAKRALESFEQPRTAAAPEVGEVPAQSISDFNAGIRAANRSENLVVAGADTACNVAPAAPNFNASVLNVIKKGLS